MKGFKITFAFLFAAGIMSLNLPAAFSQEAEEPVPPEEEAMRVQPPKDEAPEITAKEIAGTIVSIDLEKQVVVIKQLTDAENQVYEDVTLELSPQATIERNNEMITLTDLVPGEEVTIQYTADAQGKDIASYICAVITAKEPAHEPAPEPTQEPTEEATE